MDTGNASDAPEQSPIGVVRKVAEGGQGTNWMHRFHDAERVYQNTISSCLCGSNMGPFDKVFAADGDAA